jgi:hypothetical protein
LEDKLLQLPYTFENYSEENQFEFLKIFIVKSTGLLMWAVGEREFKRHQKIYAEHFIMNLSQSSSVRDNVFTSIPLQCRMFVEAFDK